jgi:hypothetical protein
MRARNSSHQQAMTGIEVLAAGLLLLLLLAGLL